MISLRADSERIISNGTAVVYRPVGDTFGICYNTNIVQYFFFNSVQNKLMELRQ